VLVEFAGAARELRQAYMCNPHDINSIKDALMRAARPTGRGAKRMHAMRRYLRDHGVRQWASDFLTRSDTTDRTEGTSHDGGPDAHGELDAGLRSAVARVARTPQLLIACDYDGTLAPLVDDPAHAVPLPAATAAIRSLAALPQTTVAVISGRALRDLAALSRLPSEVHLVGSHGTEFDVGFVSRIQPEVAELRTRLGQALHDLARNRPGIRLEQKPASVAVHTRGAERDLAAAIIEAVRSGPGRLARGARDHRQGRHRALRRRHRQGGRRQRAAHPAVGQRRHLPGRRRHRRERVLQPAGSRRRHPHR
jgi:hypothetical protein